MQFKRIKDLREDNDLFQRDIANLLGTITISHLITLAKYYNVSIDYLVGLSNFKDENNKTDKLA